MYKVTNDTVVRLIDNASIPNDVDNLDYQNYLQWISDGNMPLPSEVDIEDLKISQLQQINIAFEQAMQQITSGYPASETSSWAKQETEARAYQANNAAATPLIDALAASRSINKAELVGRIIAKADLFAGISGTLIGRRQALEDDLDALPETATAEDVAAISWL
jgi:hypothetical protein